MAGSDAEWAPASARPLEDDWAPASARALDAPVYTGAPERAEEDQKLLASMNPLERLAAGVGKGMYETHLNISDLMSHIPGLGDGKVDWSRWKDERKLAEPLSRDFFGNFGQLTGQTAMLAPAGAGAGAAVGAAAEALPAAAQAVTPLLQLATEGGAQGLVAAEPGKRVEGLKTGLALGAGSGFGGALLGRVAQRLGGKRETLRAAVEAMQRKTQEQAERSAASSLGGSVQKGSRLEEQFARYANDANLPEPVRKAIQEWRSSAASRELVGKVLENQLSDAPGVASEIEAKRAALEAARSGSEEAVQKATDEALSGRAAWDQLKARAIRYGVPSAMGAASGYMTHGTLGGLAGGATGLVLRPMMHSLRRLARNPAVRDALLQAGSDLGGTASQALQAAVPEAAAVSSAQSEPGWLQQSLIAQALRNRLAVETPAHAP